MLLIVLFSAVLATSQAWVLDTNHDEIEPGVTKDVYINCHYDSSKENTKKIAELVRIRLYSIDDKSNLYTVAEVKLNEFRQYNDDVTVTHELYGTGTTMRQSFLKATWPTASNETIGKYGCEVDGYGSDGESKVLETNTIVIRVFELTLDDLKKMFDKMKADAQEKETEMKNEIEQLKRELAESNNTSANGRRLIMQSITQETDVLRNESAEAQQALRDAISALDNKHEAEVAKLKAEVEDANNATAAVLTQLKDLDLKLDQILSNKSQENQDLHRQLSEFIRATRDRSDEEDLKLAEAISDLRNNTLDDITQQRLDIEKELLMKISQLNKQFNTTISFLETEISDMKNKSADGLTVCQEVEDRLEQEISRLSKESREGDDSLRLELLDVKNKTFEEVTRQIQETYEFLQDILSNKSDDNRETVIKLKQIISSLRNFTVNEIHIQKQYIQTLLEEEISNLKSRGSNQTTQEIQKILALVQENISDLRNISDEINTKLQEEIIDRQTESQEAHEKLEADILDLKEFTVHELLNQSEECERKIKSELFVLNSQMKEDYTQLWNEILETQNKSEHRDELLAMKLKGLSNVSLENINKQIMEFESVVQESILKMKNFTQNEILKVGAQCKETIEEGILEAKTNIEMDINSTTQSMKEELQEDISKIRNFTIFELSKQQEIDNSLLQQFKSFRRLVESEYVTNSTLSNEISMVQNSTYEEITKQQERILELKEFIEEELTILEHKMDDDHLKIYELFQNETGDCKALYSELKSNISQSHDRLFSKVHVLEKTSYESILHTKTRLVNLNKAVTDVADRYKKITDHLRAQVGQLATCACPTMLPPTPTADVITQDPGVTYQATDPTAPASGTTDGIDVNTDSPVTTTPSPTTIPTTFTTPKINEWPEGTYALVEPEAGCPVSEGFRWAQGWINFHTSSDLENHDLISSGSHFKTPIFNYDGSDNFMRLSYCLRKEKDVNARKWPRGSYCMNRVGGECPSGFTSGYIQYDGEHTHIQHQHKEAPDVRSIGGSLDRLYYCCRRDGPATTSIYLPIRSPFYLYREKSALCQRIWGMKVTSEYIQIDTNHEGNGDKFEHRETHPFADLNPVNHTLCYYTPLVRISNS